MSVLNLVDGQYRFTHPLGDSMVMGRETPIRVINVTGLTALGPIDSADVKRTGQHGTLRAGKRTYGKRTIQFDLVIEGQEYADVENLLDEFFAAVQDSDDPGILTIKRRAKEERQIECTVSRAEFVADYDSWIGKKVGSIELQANDPLVYASRLDVADVQPQATVGNGRTYDRTYDLVYGGIVPAPIVSIHNRGNTATSLIWSVTGPYENPGLKLLETGEQVRVNLTLAEGDELEVDFDLHSIQLNGSSRRTALVPDSTWWQLPKGMSRVFLLGQGLGPSASGQLQYRSAWVSA